MQKIWHIRLALAVFVIAGILLYNFSLSFGGIQPYQGTELTGEAPDFKLADQHGSVIQLSNFLGKVVVLTFMDSKCVDTCPLTAFHFRQAYQQFNTEESGQVVFVGVNANVEAGRVADVYQTTQSWRLDEIPTWYFLTGDPTELEQVWQEYNVAVHSQGGGLIHTPGTYIIDPSGQKRWYISTPFSASDNPEFALPLSELLIKHIRDILDENKSY